MSETMEFVEIDDVRRAKVGDNWDPSIFLLTKDYHQIQKCNFAQCKFCFRNFRGKGDDLYKHVAGCDKIPS